MRKAYGAFMMLSLHTLMPWKGAVPDAYAPIETARRFERMEDLATLYPRRRVRFLHSTHLQHGDQLAAWDLSVYSGAKQPYCGVRPARASAVSGHRCR